MTDTLFGEDPDKMSKLDPFNSKGKRRVIRNEDWQALWQAAEAAFYPSGIADCQRARVAKLIDGLRQKGASVLSFEARRERYVELFPQVVCTLPAMLNQWDTCGQPPKRTVQPGGSGEPERELYERITRQARAREQEQHEVDQARVIVLGAPVGVAEAMLKRWRADPDNANCVRFGRCDSPTDLLCVRWIAAEIEAMGV